MVAIEFSRCILIHVSLLRSLISSHRWSSTGWTAKLREGCIAVVGFRACSNRRKKRQDGNARPFAMFNMHET